MNLFISHVELRNEDSADLQEHTFQRRIEKVVVPLGEELTNLNIKYLKVWMYRLAIVHSPTHSLVS